jgi:hypothetical protein
MSSRLAPIVLCSLLCSLGALGCATVPTGATAEDLARAHDQASQGATTFANECARCHGQRGEGLSMTPAILGPGALPEFPRSNAGASDPALYDPQMTQIQAQTRPAGAPWRDPFRNAQDLYGFTAKHLPKDRMAEVKDGDYWAVVGYMLSAQGATLPSGGVNAANAASIPVPKR